MPHRGGNQEYKRLNPEGSYERRVDDRIKHHLEAAKDIAFRGNPHNAKIPKLAASLHKLQASRIAAESNKKRFK